MRRLLSVVAIGLITLAGFGAAAFVYARSTRLSARGAPGAIEARMARTVRAWAVSGGAREMKNPEPLTSDLLAEGLSHYADHCAVCHGADGSGNTPVGRGTWPKAPDMRQDATQRLTDGELFQIIEEGVRFTAMPGWGTGTPEGAQASWHLVHFIRHLPRMTPEDVARVEALTPRSPDEIRQEIEAEQFLQGGEPPAHEH